jgi:hypothetical protein
VTSDVLPRDSAPPNPDRRRQQPTHRTPHTALLAEITIGGPTARRSHSAYSPSATAGATAAAMDSSYLAQQVTTIIAQLHALFDEIGVPSHERDSREAEVARLRPCRRPLRTANCVQLFSALSATLHGQLQHVTDEKDALADEAQSLIDSIKQMQASLDDGKPSPKSKPRDDLRVSYPLTRCVRALKEKYVAVGKLHRERFEHVRSTLPHRCSSAALTCCRARRGSRVLCLPSRI